MNEQAQSQPRPTRELAQDWWRNQTILIEGLGEGTEDPFDSEFAVEDLVTSADTFGEMFAALVAEAPDLESLSYVGTVFLEDAYLALGPQALLLLDALDITAQAKERILSGFQMPGDPPLQR